MGWLSDLFAPKKKVEPIAAAPEPVFTEPVAGARELGALLDTRPQSEKDKDYLQKEIVASAVPVNWIEKRWEQFRRFPMQNQDGSGSCVWQTMRKLMRVLFKVNRGMDLDFSATYGYRLRANYPYSGTGGVDALNQGRKGVTLNALMPSDNLSDDQMNGAKIEAYHDEVAAVFKMPYYVQMTPGDLEAVLSTIQNTGKGVMVWYFFTSQEWSSQVPQVIDTTLKLNDDRALRHSVAAVDGGVLVNFVVNNVSMHGKRGLFIEDSAHFGGFFERFITEDFHKKRNWFAAYPINFKFEPGGNTDPAKPKYTFTKDINFSPNYFTDKDVVALQNILKFEGLFPVNTESTGYFGSITRTAVKAYQSKYNLVQTGNLDSPTRSSLNLKYGV